MNMRLSILTAVAAAMATAAMPIAAGLQARAQTAAPATAAPATITTTTIATAGPAGVNAGSLSCNVAGGVGFIFGSSKELDCLFTGANGEGQRYGGRIKRFGIDIGFTKEAQILWLVVAPGSVESGALAGDYAGLTASATVGVGFGANVLIGGSNKQIALQPVSVEGSKGLNVALGIGEITLEALK